MKKFSVILSILAAVAGLVGIYFAVVGFLKRKGCLCDEAEYDSDCRLDDACCDEEAEDNMLFNDDDEISFMGQEPSEEETYENSEEQPKK